MRYASGHVAILHYEGSGGTETTKAAEAAFLCNQKIVCRLAGHLTASLKINSVLL